MFLKDLMDGFRAYREIRGYTFKDSFFLYLCYFESALNFLLRRKNFTTVGAYLRRDILLRNRDGLLLYARAFSEDLGHYVGIAKPSTKKWFKPKAGDTVIDIGSSVGKFALFAAKLGARVFAFEANPETYAILMRNIEYNRLSNIVAFNIALGETKCKAKLFVPVHFTGTASLRPDWETRVQKKVYEVSMAPLDDFTENLERLDWLLIDVEGYEVEVLKGAMKTLKKTKRAIVEISYENQDTVMDLMSSEGFKLVERGTIQERNFYALFERPLPSVFLKRK